MVFSDIIAAIGPWLLEYAGPENDICGLAYDSRKVEPGFAFAAIPGEQADGHDYIPQAVAKGAVAVLSERKLTIRDNATLFLVRDSRRALAALSAAFYGRPDDKLRLLAVTGTNGKTTTANLIKYLLECGGHKSGVLGTVGGLAGNQPLPELLSASTTPESLELYKLLSAIEEQNCEYAVIEASSHALHQGRTSACHFAGAVFTNLTQDHLDYHHTMEAYGQAKAILFSMLDPASANRWGLVNLDDPYADYFISVCRARLLTYGQKAGADLRLLDCQASIKGMDYRVSWLGRDYQVRIPLIGLFNIYNSLAAMGAALAEGLAMEDIIGWLARAPQVPGRFELIDEGQDFGVVVDYAHTPDGLENILKAARSLKPQHLITVFGCGGNRDTTKRPIMGRLAGQLSDKVLLTSDNPRFEDPQVILGMVEEGLKETAADYLVEENRARAIEQAISLAVPGDIVVLAGKGHEDYQLIQGVKHHFDDREQARLALQKQLSASL